MAFRSGVLDQHLLTELEDRECSRDEQQDQNEDEDEEAAGAHWPGALLGVAARGNRANVPNVRTNGRVCARRHLWSSDAARMGEKGQSWRSCDDDRRFLRASTGAGS